MSLDLYIKRRTPLRKQGTGVFVREKGQTLELKTIEEVREYFPDKDLSGIRIIEQEDGVFWHGNVTHNLGAMAAAVPVEGSVLTLYDLLWHPGRHGFGDAGSEGYRENVLKGFLFLRGHREELLPLNPENGWGGYDLLLGFTRDYLFHLVQAEDDCGIEASR
jgi:hypothetical protein